MICGDIAAACYFPRTDTMVIVGEAAFGGLPTSYVAAHEYGHHIENHRRNAPWPALGWGTKRWSTYVGVCPRYAAGKLYPGERFGEFPGSEESFYWQNPGEAFAEAYARYHPPFRAQPWQWIRSLEPNGAAYDRIRADVTQPWTGNRTASYATRLRKGQLARKKFSTPLDGKLILKLRGPKRADFDLYLTDAKGRPLARSVRKGSRERIRFGVCGDAKMGFAVRAHRGSGKLRVSVSKP